MGLRWKQCIELLPKAPKRWAMARAGSIHTRGSKAGEQLKQSNNGTTACASPDKALWLRHKPKLHSKHKNPMLVFDHGRETIGASKICPKNHIVASPLPTGRSVGYRLGPCCTPHPAYFLPAACLQHSDQPIVGLRSDAVHGATH